MQCWILSANTFPQLFVDYIGGVWVKKKSFKTVIHHCRMHQYVLNILLCRWSIKRKLFLHATYGWRRRPIEVENNFSFGYYLRKSIFCIDEVHFGETCGPIKKTFLRDTRSSKKAKFFFFFWNPARELSGSKSHEKRN